MSPPEPPPTGAPPTGPIPDAERARAPDLARGWMLLLIALSNVLIFLYGRPYGPREHLLETGWLDRAWTVISVVVVEGRAYPLFAALFGYGMVRLAARQRAGGADQATANRTLVRRNALLVAFGAVHGLLLFSGDVLATYGLVGLILTAVLGATTNRELLVAAAWCLIPLAVLGSASGLTGDNPEERLAYRSLAVDDPLAAAGLRLTEWPGTTLTMGLLVLTPMLIGIWAGREQILDRPERHRALLRRVAVAGLSVGLVSGVPMALAAAGVLSGSGRAGSLGFQLISGTLHTVGGVAGGLGYAALFGLLAIRARPGSSGGPVVALGRRSLTFYLAQSVVFVTLLAPYGAGLGGTLGPFGAACIALSTWFGSLLVAAALARTGRRGPAEALLRRLVYRPLPTRK